MVEAGEVADEAAAVVRADKEYHGDATEVQQKIADLWSEFLGVDIRPWQVAAMMMLMKLARAQCGDQLKDHFRDAAGYADTAWQSAVDDPEANDRTKGRDD